jgi:hypothetical protein
VYRTSSLLQENVHKLNGDLRNFIIDTILLVEQIKTDYTDQYKHTIVKGMLNRKDYLEDHRYGWRNNMNLKRRGFGEVGCRWLKIESDDG